MPAVTGETMMALLDVDWAGMPPSLEASKVATTREAPGRRASARLGHFPVVMVHGSAAALPLSPELSDAHI
jgi:hypothetical protein